MPPARPSDPAITQPTSKYVDIDGLRLHYLEAGAGPPVLLLHGWPTSSFLYRDVIGRLAESSRVIALDLPGFGRSDKPPDAPYSFPFYTRVLDGFAAAAGLDETGLVVHDLGGPVGLYWACQRPERIRKLAILNTLVYPQLHWSVIAFVAACRLPLVRALLTSPLGLAATMRLGVADPRRLSEEAVRGVQAPYRDASARRALARAGAGLHPRGLAEIARRLPSLRVPVRLIYGARDRVLPDVARTMARLARDLPQAEVTVLEDCGHFLQEERPAELAAHLAAFFARPTT